MSDPSPDSASARDESSPAADLASGPDPATESSLGAPTGTPAAQPDPGAVQWPPSPPPGGFGAPDPGTYQSPYGPPPPGAFGAPDPGTYQPPYGAPPAGAYPGGYPAGGQRPSRHMRGPLIGFLAGVVAVALAVGGYEIASNVSNSGNKPIPTSVRAKSSGITVTGHGIQLTFPAGWENVPTSRNQLRQFIKDFTAKYRHIPSQLENDVTNSQFLSSIAMLVFRFDAQGNATENLAAVVEPEAVPPSTMIAGLKSGEGPAQLGARDVQYSTTNFGRYPGVIVTYSLQSEGLIYYGAESWLDGPAESVITEVTSESAATSEADLRQIVGTIKFV